MIKIYGIKNCDTVKKALNWLTSHNIEYDFHDYKKQGVDQKKLSAFVEKFGFEKIVNRKGTTWRQLDKAEQEKVVDNKSALELMLAKPSVIKRPIVDLGNQQLVGFDAQEFEKVFNVN
jgi:arsenate reductase (glutaredoxin)